MTSTDIAVLGAGPAGVAAAVGLVRQGAAVTLIAAARPVPTCEGLSERTWAALRDFGLNAAAETAAAPSARRVSWNGKTSSANRERLVLRKDFDRALLDDARRAGVHVLEGRGRRLSHATQRLAVQLAGGGEREIDCDFLIEARGRAAAVPPGTQRGPSSIALLQRYRCAAEEPCSFLCSLPQGWLWLASPGDGTAFVMLCIDGRSDLPGRQALGDWFQAQIHDLPPVLATLRGASPDGPVQARGCTSLLKRGLVQSRCLRIGDAALSVDPLSGNGQFQALSSALVAPAVVNSLLAGGDEADLAADFYSRRVRETFMRFARLGRDFYAGEARWSETAFWRPRRQWPDDLPVHGERRVCTVEERPVVEDGRIRRRRVVITDDQPLGVWHVAGLPLAPLMDDLPSEPAERQRALQERVDAACSQRPAARQPLQAWLRSYALL